MDLNAKHVNTLSNFEVLTLLNELKPSKPIPNEKNQLSIVAYEASQYLQNLNNEFIGNDMRGILMALSNYSVPLTLKEKLMIVNILPKTSLELSMLVSDYDARFSEEDIDALIEIVQQNSTAK